MRIICTYLFECENRLSLLKSPQISNYSLILSFSLTPKTAAILQRRGFTVDCSNLSGRSEAAQVTSSRNLLRQPEGKVSSQLDTPKLHPNKTQ